MLMLRPSRTGRFGARVIPPAPPVEGTWSDSIERHGITWSLGTAYRYGQYTNGDYWVRPNSTGGSVGVSGITRPNATATLDGSTLNPTGNDNGYDSRLGSYNGSLNVANSLPLSLEAGQSLVSVISWGTGMSGYPNAPSGPKVSKSGNCTVLAGSPTIVTCSSGWGSVTTGDFLIWDSNGVKELRIVQTVNGNDATVDVACTPGANKSAYGGGTLRPGTKVAAVLTCVADVPDDTEFRPAYAGDTKTRYDFADVDTGRLASLDPYGTPPDIAEVETWFDKLWLDHGNNYSFMECVSPTDAMNWYGQYNCNNYGIATTLLQLNTLTSAEKEMLLKRLIQIGIDYYGAAASGSIWPANGGHASGRKWPILFAGYMLNDATMLAVGSQTRTSSAWRFGEDEQTWTIAESDVGRALESCVTGTAAAGGASSITLAANPPNNYELKDLDIIITSGTGVGQRRTITGYDGGTHVATVDSTWSTIPSTDSVYQVVGYEEGDVGVAEWGIRHYAEPNIDNPSWYAPYRRCCTAFAWGGEVLCAKILGLTDEWNWPALFDYVDRYVATETGGYDFESSFVKAMWNAYRGSY